MPVLPYLDHLPSVGAGVRLADEAYVIGKVTLQGPAVLEPNAVARGDQSPIMLGPRFRLGRGSTIHVESQLGTLVGADVWVGNDAVLHACTLGDGVRVEDGGVLLSGSSVGTGSIVAADALVPEGAVFPEHSYLVGTPARRLRDTTPEERAETLRRTRQTDSV